MKRTLAALLALCSLFSAFLCLGGETFAKENWTYTLTDGVLTVTGSGPVGNDDSPLDFYPWHALRGEIRRVIVEDGITAVGKNCFSTCPNLRTAEMGSDMSHLGMDAFAYCGSLTELTFHHPLTYIGQGTVYQSSNLRKVTITGQTAQQFLQISAMYSFNEQYASARITVTEGGETETLPDFGGKPISFKPAPEGGIIENYPSADGVQSDDAFTCMKVGALPADALTGLIGGKYTLRVTLRDEKADLNYYIDSYTVGDAERELAGKNTLRMTFGRYGITLRADGVYTLTLEFFEGEGLAAYGTSNVGAFRSPSDRAFREKGAIPYTGEILFCRTYERVTGDLTHNAQVEISDLTYLLALLEGHTEKDAEDAPDLNFDGTVDERDRETLLSFLAGGESLAYSPNASGDAYTVSGRGNVRSETVTVPEEWNGKPVLAVGVDVFRNNARVGRIFLPSSVKRVAPGAFLGCTTLERIDFDGTVRDWMACGADPDARVLVAVKEETDPFDLLDLDGVPKLSNLGGYSDGLRVKSTGEILFSPNLNELRSLVDGGRSYDEFTAYLRFTDVTENRIFPSFTAKPVKSKGEWVDFFLAGPDGTLFCPRASTRYRIETVLVEDATGIALYADVFTMTAPYSIMGSAYYAPTELGKNVLPGGKYEIRYAVGDGGELRGTSLQYVEKGGSTEKVSIRAKPGYSFVSWSDGVRSTTRSESDVKSSATVTAYFAPEVEKTGVANIFLYTQTGNPVTTKNYEDVTVLVCDSEGGKYDLAASALIKGRGNSTWNGGAPQNDHESKNSYHLKFDQKQSLLGLGDGKYRDYVLLANKWETSNISNYTMWTLAKKMGTIPFVVDATWAQIYVNNEYRGLYNICEQIEVAKGRVDIDDSNASPDKGYLMEIDFRGSDGDPCFYVDGYAGTLHEGPPFVIKSEISGDEDLEFITDFMQKCHDAIMSGDREKMAEYVDMASFIDMYIIEELSRDVDAGRASFYMQRPAGGKLYITAPWDFDLGYRGSTSGFVSQGGNCCTWYAELINHRWFRDEVLARMKELQPVFDEAMAEVLETGRKISAAADKDAYFWGLIASGASSYERQIEPTEDWTVKRWKGLMTTIKNKR